MTLKSQKEFFSGLMFVVIGMAFALGALRFDIGTTERMGPGYFPLLVGTLTVILGSIILVKSFVAKAKDGDKIGAWAWRPMIFIIAANLAFGILLDGLPSIHLPAMGLIIAIYVLTFIASMAGDEFNLKETAVLATVLTIASYVGFVVLLKLQFPIWPAFIGR
jgi:hypothetical protein